MKVTCFDLRHRLQTEISNLQLIEAVEHHGVLFAIISVLKVEEFGIVIQAKEIISPFLVKKIFLSHAFSKYLSVACHPTSIEIINALQESSTVLISLLDMIELSDFIICNVWKPGYYLN